MLDWGQLVVQPTSQEAGLPPALSLALPTLPHRFSRAGVCKDYSDVRGLGNIRGLAGQAKHTGTHGACPPPKLDTTLECRKLQTIL